MCGIVGYVGPKECAPILVEGLRRLEYRGYDSAGLAVLQRRVASRSSRAVGKLTNLDAALQKQPLPGRRASGTPAGRRTAGRRGNAHPHVAGNVAVVHNGIIENHGALRRELEAHGLPFSSDTDTEIVAHLIDRR